MDSVTQLALGAAVGVAVMGRRTAIWKAALWGGVCGTLPDLDTFIDHGDPISNMTLHRTESHALFYLTLVSPLIAALAAKLHRETDRWRRWWLAVWLALITHPLLDLMTVYGTQLGLPFTDHPYAVGSIFVVDPVYTLPLMAGVIAALVARSTRGWRWNAAGLAFSTCYLAWSAAAQQHVRAVAVDSLRDQGAPVTQLLVTPTPFNTLLWRVVAVTPQGYSEGFYSLLDEHRRIVFERHARGEALYDELRALPQVQRIAWFSHGFFKLGERAGELTITDLRMGQEPTYTFSFVVARRENPHPVAVPPRMVGQRPDVAPALQWLWRRMRGEVIAPPR